ncbi:MAG: DUF2961 domain-containing protein, partial [Kiritimatiellaeota bacterium]|nr:DUF2961 domain-containing protein [Kiritimatiellota bacterium]
MKMNVYLRGIVVAGCLCGLLVSSGCRTPQISSPMAQSREAFVIQPGVQTRGINAFWYVDQQYRDTPTLKPGAAVTVADLKGPGMITAIHMTQADINMRGMVLEIRYDGAKEPAVMCPISDFFADGCNKRSVNF